VGGSSELGVISFYNIKLGMSAELINQYFDPNQYFPQGVTMLEFESFSLSPEKPKD
jgi:PIN domain nuclease of toxin-antitoxin system